MDVLPEASVAVHVTVVTPLRNADGVSLVITIVPVQLSVAVALPRETLVALHIPASVLTDTLAGGVITGFSVSFTVTVNEQVSPVPAVTFTVVIPLEKKEPEAGIAVTVPQIIVDATLKLTTAPHWPGSFETTMGSGD